MSKGRFMLNEGVAKHPELCNHTPMCHVDVANTLHTEVLLASFALL